MRLAVPFACLFHCGGAADAKLVKIEHHSPELEFTYEWPAQAARVFALEHRFRAEAAREYRRHLNLGREDKRLYAQQLRGTVSDYEIDLPVTRQLIAAIKPVYRGSFELQLQ